MWTIFWIILASHVHRLKSICTFRHQHHLACTKHPPSQRVINTTITIIELQEMEVEMLDLSELIAMFPDTENISIYGGTIDKINPPEVPNNVKVLQMVRIGVGHGANSFLKKFPNLETLNLQGNLLQSWTTNLSMSNLTSLYLADNRWNCSVDLDWVFQLNKSLVKDFHNLTCFGEPHARKSLFVIAQFMKEIKEQCPGNCVCSLPKVVPVNLESDQLEPVIEVNCSYRGLTQLPVDLPLKSKIIHLEGNEIEDVAPLKLSSIYRQAFDVYLDNNKIKGIEELEGSYWLKHFRVFSLSGNKLTEIPTYAIDNALEENSYMPHALRMTLGGNPWRCDCVFTPVFQEMLQKFENQIDDIHEVKCSYVEGDENSLLPIIELSRSSVCRSPAEYSVQALDLLNIVLASLILLILGKLGYDYYFFKKTGKLPWIVTKMP